MNHGDYEYEPRKICRLVCKDKCLETLRCLPGFNARTVIDRMLDTVNPPELLELDTITCMQNTEKEDAQHRNFSRDRKVNPQDKLLQFVASHRGEVLQAFLEAMEKDYPALYKLLRKRFDRALNTYPCNLSALDSGVLKPACRKLLKKKLTDDERRLLICYECKEVMDDPVLLACLHSFCRHCAEELSSCTICDRNIEGLTPVKNLYVLSRIATAAKRIRSEDGSHSNGRLPSGGGQGCCSMECGTPMCSVHGHRMKSWCSTCGDFRCYTYSAGVCGQSNHTYCSMDVEADKVREWIAAFSEPELEVDVANNGIACLPTQSDQKSFTQKYLDILTKKEQFLKTATDFAFKNALRSVKEYYGDFHKEAKGMLEQLSQACLYARSIREHDLFVFDQRELIFQQLRLLLLRTGKADQCSNLPEVDKRCSGQPNGNVKRLVIECLPDDYIAAITEELLGRIDAAETDSPTHHFWDKDCSVKKEKENLRSIAELNSQVENTRNELGATTQLLHQTRETVKCLQQQLDDKQKEIKELQAKVASEFTSSIGDSGLERNLQTTMPYVIHHMTEGEVADVLTYLRSKCCLLDRDVQNVKTVQGDINRAQALIEVIVTKGPYCQKVFLRVLLNHMSRKNLVDVIISGQCPDNWR